MAKYITYIAVLANIILALWVYSQPKVPSIDEKIKAIPVNKRLVLISELNQPGEDLIEEAVSEEIPLPEIEVVQADQNPESEDQSSSNTETPPLVGTPQKSQVCYTVGPFLSGQEANKVGKSMQDRSLVVSRRDKVEQVVDGYRVYIKSLPSREEAVAVTRELTDLGVLDYFIINKKEHRNGISLGMFKQKAGAIRRMAQIRRFNFNVAMEARQRDTRVYWLDVTDSNNDFSQQFWLEITETRGQLQRLTKKC